MAALRIQHNLRMCTAVQVVCDFPHFTFLKLVKAVLNSSADKEDLFHMHASNCDALLQNSCFWPTKLYAVLLLHTCHHSDCGRSSVYDS